MSYQTTPRHRLLGNIPGGPISNLRTEFIYEADVQFQEGDAVPVPPPAQAQEEPVPVLEDIPVQEAPPAEEPISPEPDNIPEGEGEELPDFPFPDYPLPDAQPRDSYGLLGAQTPEQERSWRLREFSTCACH